MTRATQSATRRRPRHVRCGRSDVECRLHRGRTHDVPGTLCFPTGPAGFVAVGRGFGHVSQGKGCARAESEGESHGKGQGESQGRRSSSADCVLLALLFFLCYFSYFLLPEAEPPAKPALGKPATAGPERSERRSTWCPPRPPRLRGLQTHIHVCGSTEEDRLVLTAFPCSDGVWVLEMPRQFRSARA